MCGIAGYLSTSVSGQAEAEALATRMAATLTARGPDDDGAWVDAEAGIGLGHTRLSVVDLSPAGKQPMTSACGRYVIAYNGEIYGHDALRLDLPGPFRGHSDTEAALETIAARGMAEALEQFNGMYAFALWDRERRELTLARDPIGIKPLYYGFVKGSLLFASQPKAFRPFPGFAGEVDRASVAAYLRYGYVPAPRSIFRDVRKLLPGETAVFRLEDEAVEVDRSRLRTEPDSDAGGLSETEALDRAANLLGDAVGIRTVADVPLGALLSGGTDSSLVTALMQERSDRPVRTFTVGFDSADFDESDYARQVADRMGTDHTELRVSPDDALKVVPDIPDIYDEPLGDSSQIPTVLISRLARRDVTVALSGDGGDEGFGGYDRYALVPKMWRSVAWLPRPFRRVASGALRVMPSAVLHAALAAAGPVTQNFGSTARRNDKLYRIGALVGASGPAAMYDEVMTLWDEPDRVAVGAGESPAVTEEVAGGVLGGKPDAAAFATWMMSRDLADYLPDDVLTKVDRASMSVGLEIRVPLLDRRVVAFGHGLRNDLRARDGVGKYLLRKLLTRYLPEDLVNRPKRGFGVPVDAWLRGPLRDWAESLLDPARLGVEGFLDPSRVGRVWQRHLDGRLNASQALWAVLMFQGWLERQR